MMLRRSVSSLEGHVTLRSSPTTSPIMRTLNARRATSPPTLRVTPGSLATTISPRDAARADGSADRTSSAPSAAGRFVGSCWSGTSDLDRSCSQALPEFWLLPDGPSCICSWSCQRIRVIRWPIQGHRIMEATSSDGDSCSVAPSGSGRPGRGRGFNHFDDAC